MLSKRALVDPLTGLGNRQVLQDGLHRDIEQARRQREPLSVLLVDIDHFKSVNDTYGHACGDEVLRAVAETLLSAVRACDTVARYGGEEFAVLLPFTSATGGVLVAERIHTALGRVCVLFEGHDVSFTASIGGTTSDGSATGTQMLAAADTALYQAKHAGRDRCRWADCALPAPGWTDVDMHETTVTADPASVVSAKIAAG